MEIGTAFTISELSDDSFRPNGLRGRTVMTQDTFYEPVYVKGQRRRWEADVDWAVGPASARAEFTIVTDDREQQSIGNTDLTDARARSWYVSGTWVLTGEEQDPAAEGGRAVRAGWHRRHRGRGAIRAAVVRQRRRRRAAIPQLPGRNHLPEPASAC